MQTKIVNLAKRAASLPLKFNDTNPNHKLDLGNWLIDNLYRGTFKL